MLILALIIEGGTFALWSGRNNTMAHQYYTINNGDLVREKYCQVSSYNGQQRLPATWWSPMGPTPSLHRAGYEGMCRGIHGTDGQQFHPGLSEGEELWLFTPDLCRYSVQFSLSIVNSSLIPPFLFRSFLLKYFHDVTVNGIRTYHYEVPESVFTLTNSNNLCYCHNVSAGRSLQPLRQPIILGGQVCCGPAGGGSVGHVRMSSLFGWTFQHSGLPGSSGLWKWTSLPLRR